MACPDLMGRRKGGELMTAKAQAPRVVVLVRQAVPALRSYEP